MANLKDFISDDQGINWLKSNLSLKITRKGLIGLVDGEMQSLQKDSYNKARTTPRAACNQCCTTNLLVGLPRYKYPNNKPPPKTNHCPNSICDGIRQNIESEHCFRRPSWKNSDAKQWSTNHWQFAKCYMPPDGYAQVLSATDTDFNGIINVLINCKRFDGKFTFPNVLTQARDIGRTLRHKNDIRVSNGDLKETFRTLKALLNEPAFGQEGQGAVAQLQKLQNDDVVIDVKEIIALINETKETALSEIQSERNAAHIQMLEHLDEVFAREEERLHRVMDEKASSSDAHGQTYSFEERKSGLKEDLIYFYKENYSSLPLGPQFADYDSKMVDCYIPPNLSSVELKESSEHKNSPLSQKEKRKPVQSFSEMFSEKNLIFVSGQAGFGKTSFCKFLTFVWCLIQMGENEMISRIKSSRDSLYADMAAVLRKFEFVFLIPLRLTSDKLCEINDMVCKVLFPELRRFKSLKIDIELLETILMKEKCLIILDGLDEWKHPSFGCFRKNLTVPHTQNYNLCSLLITARPWKLSDAEIKMSRFNGFIEIEILDDKQILRLIGYINDCLSEIMGPRKDVGEFLNYISTHKLKDLLSNPLVIMQMMRLWYDGKPIGKSRCEVYSNMIDFFLVNAKERNEILANKVACVTESTCLPDCFAEHSCHSFKGLVLKLGKLAFMAFFSDEASEQYAFREELVNVIIEDSSQREFAYETGLLSKMWIQSRYTYRECKVSFLHSTYQEMLCAVYMAIVSFDSESTECIHMIGQYNKNINNAAIDFIVFLSGVSLPLARDASEKMSKFSPNALTSSVNESKYVWIKDIKVLGETILRAYEESTANGMPDANTLLLRHIVLEHGRLSHPLIQFNRDKLVSLGYTCYFDIPDLQTEFDDLSSIIKDSSPTLTTIGIHLPSEHSRALDPRSFSVCRQLHTLVLYNVELPERILDLTSCEQLYDLSLKYLLKHELKVIIRPCKMYCCRLLGVGHSDCERIVLRFAKGNQFTSRLKELRLRNVRVEAEIDLNDTLVEILELTNVSMNRVSIDTSCVIECHLGGYIGQS
ncbi:uncharacterized protein LOC128225189 [Mya arenaria]|uniref:uncharacterized protein LOC128225189 n=1 Tax=Mya arenaria TaxID=6604 RepID=UPI0022E8A9CE|nr:uncharacterized protein LOC128225189 [Mya arenaria]